MKKPATTILATGCSILLGAHAPLATALDDDLNVPQIPKAAVVTSAAVSTADIVIVTSTITDAEYRVEPPLPPLPALSKRS